MNWHTGITGYLIVYLWGDDPERVINMAVSRGIRIWDIKQRDDGRYLLKVRRGEYRALRVLSRRSSCRVKVAGKRGLPFIALRVRRRKILTAGLLFFCLALYTLSCFVWSIEIEGNERITVEEITLAAEDCGLKKGALKYNLKQDELGEKLLAALPELTWVGVRLEGTKAIIKVAEKIPSPSEEETAPAHLLAGCDGKIEEILVLTGTPLVKEGDVVQKGQVLIAGFTYPEIVYDQNGEPVGKGQPEKVRARGLVRAYVKRSCEMECPIKEERTCDSGNMFKIVLLRFAGREIVLKGPGEVPYEIYRTVEQVKTLYGGRNKQGAVEIITIEYLEQLREVRYWGLKGAYQEALNKAKEEMLVLLPKDCRVVAEKNEPADEELKDVVRVRYILETIENIGVY